jgi:hypothetical protein
MATATSEYNVYFSGQSVLGGLTTPVDVGIGWPTTQPLTAKLDVVNFTQTTTMFNYNNKTAGSFYETGSYTIYPPLDEFVGVMGITDVTGSGKRNNLGGDFYARYTANNIGARGTGDDFQASNIGLWGNALNGVNNIGVKSTVTIPSSPSANIGVLSEVGPSFGGFPVGTTIGVYGSVPPNGTGTRAIYGDLGIGLTFPCPTWPCPASPYAPDAAGYFNGDVVATNGVYALSDENLKENIHDIPNAMDILNQLNPKWYSFKQTENASMQLPKGSHYGLLSQDVQQVLPNIVKDCIHPARMDSDGNETYAAINFKAINYTELIPLLIASVKQMDSTNQALQQQISDLQAAQTGHRASPPHDNNSDQGQDQGQAKPNAPIDVTLSSKSIVLDQNQPNPFKEQTTITYFIPDDAMNVKMIFTDSRGNVMKEVSIPEKGNGQLNVYAQDLSSGIYTYTLVADGVTIDSKKMVCNK